MGQRKTTGVVEKDVTDEKVILDQENSCEDPDGLYDFVCNFLVTSPVLHRRLGQGIDRKLGRHGTK